MAGYDLRKIFEEIELDLIHNLRRNMKRHDIEEQKEGFQWEMWQKAKMRNLNKFRRENMDLVGSRSNQIDDTIEQSIRTSYKTGQTLFERAINFVKRLFTRKKPILEVPTEIKEKVLATVPDEQAFFGVNEKKIRVLDTAIKKDITRGKNAIVRRMDDVYRQTLYKTEMYLTAGTKTLPQAIDMATKEFLAKGIDCIEYKDGRRVNIASYAEMALRTMSHRATLVAEGQKRNEYGIYTVVVSAHSNTCEKCAPWQGLVLIDDVFSNGKPVFGYPLLSTAIKMGLLHPNCRHTISTFFPGISKLPIIPDAKQAIALNNAEQKQREIERNIRKWKRIAEGSIDSDNIKFAHDKVAEYQSRLKDHLAENDKLRRDPTRENTKGIGYNPKSSMESGGYRDGGIAESLLQRDYDAERFYSDMRLNNKDVKLISKNTGWSEQSIARIKNYIFYDKHQLENSFGRFDASYDMAIAWKRMQEGKYENRDILLLKHEYLESIVEKKYSITYREAHEIASKKHDWNNILEKEVGAYGDTGSLYEIDK